MLSSDFALNSRLYDERLLFKRRISPFFCSRNSLLEQMQKMGIRYWLEVPVHTKDTGIENVRAHHQFTGGYDDGTFSTKGTWSVIRV